jgi:hypothetical protein
VLPRSEEIKDLALKFSKQQLSGLAQRGEIDPMTAVMAGMMRDRIVSEEMRQNMPETTVADDVLGAAQQMGQPQGVGQPQDQFAQMRQPVEGQPQMAMMAEGGLASIPFDDGMFDYAGGGIVAFSNGGTPSQRILDSLSLPELQEYYRTKKLPRRFEIMADPSVSGMVTDPIFGGMPQDQGSLMPSINVEDIIAQAQRGEGPNVSRPAAPADVAVVPPGGPVIPRPTGVAESAPVRSVVKKPEGEKKPGSIFDEAANAATKLKAYKTQFGLTDTDPDAALRAKLSELQKGSKDERREAAYMAMIMAGLGIAGGTSPYFAVNLKEAIPALKEFGVAKRDIKKAEMEYTKMEADLNRAADARKRGDMELALRLQESAADRELRLQQIVIAEKTANKPSQLRELIELAAGGDKSKMQPLAQAALSGKTGPKPMSQYERATLQQRAMQNAATELSKNTAYGRLSRSNKPEDQAAAKKMRDDLIADYMARIGGASNLGGATFLGYEE